MSTVASKTRFTPEDLLTMPDRDRYELVDGHLVEQNVSTWSSYVAGVVFQALHAYCQQNRLGWTLPEGTTYQCFPNAPAMVRRADVSFIRLERLSLAQATAEGHCPVVPDLVVEVISPNDTVYEVDAKVQLYLHAGTRLVWVVNPQQQIVEVHRATGLGTILRPNDELTGEDVVVGFRRRVGDLFQPPAGVGTGATDGSG
jgi:Uma2 family endonuclease